MNVYQALSAVMCDVSGVGKHDKNTAPNGGFMFRGIDAVVNAVGPALRKHGVIVVPEVLDKTYGTVVVGKNRTEMGHSQVTIAFTWFGPEGDSIRSVVAAEAMDSGDKATAKAHSVAFRTAMIQTLALPTDEPDPDSETHVRSGAPANPGHHRPEDPAGKPAAKPAVQPTPLMAIRTRLSEIAAHQALNLGTEFQKWATKTGIALEITLGTADTATLTAFANSLSPEPTTKVKRA